MTIGSVGTWGLFNMEVVPSHLKRHCLFENWFLDILSRNPSRFLKVTKYDATLANYLRFILLFFIPEYLFVPEIRYLLDVEIFFLWKYSINLFHTYGTEEKVIKYSVQWYQLSTF